MERVEKLCERARSLAESGTGLEGAAAELLGIANGDRWVVEAALARREDTARQAPADPTSSRSVALLRSLLALDVLR